MINVSAATTNSISFGDRLAASSTFDTLFAEGMGLVERTAAYLDGSGREESRGLGRAAALSYASESMRLTTRLMQIASWLLLQRAINEGEMTQLEAAADKTRTRTSWEAVPPPSQNAAALPAALLDLVARSLDLQERIRRLDLAIRPMAEAAPVAHPLDAQFARLREAFAS